jgi:hypothetical protein
MRCGTSVMAPPLQITSERKQTLSDIERYGQGGLTRRHELRTARALARVEHDVAIRLARSRGESLVAAQKASEISFVARTALTELSLLRQWADTLTAGELFAMDDAQLFFNQAKLGMAQVVGDLVTTYCREARR